MMTREEALAYGMSFDNVYEEKPFRDPNWLPELFHPK